MDWAEVAVGSHRRAGRMGFDGPDSRWCMSLRMGLGAHCVRWLDRDWTWVKTEGRWDSGESCCCDHWNGWVLSIRSLNHPVLHRKHLEYSTGLLERDSVHSAQSDACLGRCDGWSHTCHLFH